MTMATMKYSQRVLVGSRALANKIFVKCQNRRMPGDRWQSSTTLKDSYDFVQTERNGAVGLIRLHRPEALNALSSPLFKDLQHAADAFDNDDNVGCIVLTGSTKAFAAGADIKEMADKTFDEAYSKVGHDFLFLL